MIDFKDVTFIIPVRFDSEDRKRNFRITIAFLEKHFDTNIIVMESDKTSNEEFVKSISEKLTYVFEKNDSHLFHRTKMLNDMTILFFRMLVNSMIYHQHILIIYQITSLIRLV